MNHAHTMISWDKVLDSSSGGLAYKIHHLADKFGRELQKFASFAISACSSVCLHVTI